MYTINILTGTWMVNTVQCSAVIMWLFKKKYQQKTHHSSPVRAKYGVSFVDPATDWYSALISATINAISYYIGPRYNSTWLYVVLQ